MPCMQRQIRLLWQKNGRKGKIRKMKRIVFMGTPEFSLPAMERLVACGYEIVAVYTQPDKPAGRGRVPNPSPVKVKAQEYGISVLQLESFRNSSEIEYLSSLNPDIIVVVAFGQMLSRKVLDIPAFGCLNIHPSLLPRYRGSSPVASAILRGDTETGVTIMLLDAGVDTGPILTQKRVFMEPEDTTESLENKLSEIGADLLVETMPAWFEQKLSPKRQEDGEATYTSQISKNDGAINWQLSANELEKRVRAFHPWPGSYTRWRGKTLKVVQSTPVASAEPTEPGMVVDLASHTGTFSGVATGEGILGLLKVQLEGRKVMPISDFMRGNRGFVGEKLG